jgi:hypothetical protein
MVLWALVCIQHLKKLRDPDLSFLKSSDLDRGAEAQNVAILSKYAKKCLTFATFLGCLYFGFEKVFLLFRRKNKIMKKKAFEMFY